LYVKEQNYAKIICTDKSVSKIDRLWIRTLSVQVKIWNSKQNENRTEALFMLICIYGYCRIQY